LDILVEGGVQDSAAKSNCDGAIAVLKGMNHDGLRTDGADAEKFYG